jgi:peptidoglycan hydrolase-like protein with peptidoglycan-binding domain
MAWVPANGPLEAGDCAAFTALTYQTGAARQEDPAVADLQARLLGLGFDGGPPDGLYGERTRDGVMAFQEARGLPATGNADCATWQALLAQP